MRSTQEATRLLATVRDRSPAVTYAPTGSALYPPVLFGGRERPTVAAHRSGRSARSTGPVDARWWRSMSGCHGAAHKKLRPARGARCEMVRLGIYGCVRARPDPCRSFSGLTVLRGCSLWTALALRRSHGHRRTGDRDKISASRLRGEPPAVLRFDEGDQAMRSDTRPVIRWSPAERVWETGCRGYSVLSIPRLNKGTAFTDSERRRGRLQEHRPPAPQTSRNAPDHRRRRFACGDPPPCRGVVGFLWGGGRSLPTPTPAPRRCAPRWWWWGCWLDAPQVPDGLRRPE